MRILKYTLQKCVVNRYMNTFFIYIQMTAAKAREACQHLWMKEALDILVDRLTSAQTQKDEEEVSACSLS